MICEQTLLSKLGEKSSEGGSRMNGKAVLNISLHAFGLIVLLVVFWDEASWSWMAVGALNA